jgi:hypothetical protein
MFRPDRFPRLDFDELGGDPDLGRRPPYAGSAAEILVTLGPKIIEAEKPSLEAKDGPQTDCKTYTSLQDLG